MLGTTEQHSTEDGPRSALRPCMTFRILWDTSERAHAGQACRHNAACKFSCLRLHSLHTELLKAALQSPMLPDCRLGQATARTLLQPAQACFVVLEQSLAAPEGIMNHFKGDTALQPSSSRIGLRDEELLMQTYLEITREVHVMF